MATTTASITLNSADILSNAISLSKTSTLYHGGTTATGLTQFKSGKVNVYVTGASFDLIPALASEEASATNSYVYIVNKDTTAANYVNISIYNEVIGRLYAGDWLFMPWDCDLTAAANDSSIECQAYTGENIIEYALFHNGETLLTAADS